MKRFKKILVATDTRLDQNPIVEEAAEIAHFNRASLKIVDVVPPFSWISRHSTEDHQHLSELIEKEKKEKLAALVEMIQGKGVDVTSRILIGKASVEITKEVIRGDHDVVMAVARGRNSRSKGFFGYTATRLLRQCPSAVWLVAPDSVAKFKHILGCVDPTSDNALDTELNEKIFELSQSISKYYDSRYSILHAWFMDDEALLGARLTSDHVASYERDERQYHEERLDKFLDQFDCSCAAGNVHLIKGRTPETIAEFVSANAVDLLVMGTVARKGIGNYFIGNTAEKILDHVKCSVLALKPSGFKSSIKA